MGLDQVTARGTQLDTTTGARPSGRFNVRTEITKRLTCGLTTLKRLYAAPHNGLRSVAVPRLAPARGPPSEAAKAEGRNGADERK